VGFDLVGQEDFPDLLKFNEGGILGFHGEFL